MTHHPAIARYVNQYVELQFERSGLFRTVAEHWSIRTALYPGSFIHITPSFSIPHVVYVDRHPTAAAFFAEHEAIAAYIAQQKVYNRAVFFRFIEQDYTIPLDLPAASFDLLIALYAPQIIPACLPYLRPGGLLLTNEHHDNLRDALQQPELSLLAQIVYQSHRYQIIPATPEQGRSAKPRRGAGMRRSNRGLAYREQEPYYIFRKQ